MKQHSTRPPTPLHTVDGATLMERPPEQIPFVVDDFLSHGLHILAGSPKVGKSWLALLLGVQVAKGEPLWGMDTKEGTTLYLCLEDNHRRIYNRLLYITEDVPAKAHYAIGAECVGRGLEEQLSLFIQQHPDTVLIIIDTIQKVRATTFDNTYATDYRDLSTLKALADEHDIAILLIHHLRKEDAKDSFDRISGTTAMQGAVDSCFTLVEDTRGSGRAILSCVGRDIEFRELELKRNEENVWELVGDSRAANTIDPIVKSIEKLMENRVEYTDTPAALASLLSLGSDDIITDRAVRRRLTENVNRLSSLGISFTFRRSNGKRLVCLHKQSAGSDLASGISPPPPSCDTIVTSGLPPH